MKYRVEDKFVCSWQELFLMENRISKILHADQNRLPGQGYTIRSVYFDDAADSCLYDTINGVRSRKKYRIRIYDASLRTIKLEVKFKEANRIHKKSCSITEEQMNMLLNGRCIAEDKPSMNSPVTLFNMAIQTALLRPKVIVEYDRNAYINWAGNVRITFDRNVRYSNKVYAFGSSDLVCHSVEKPTDVLEVKYDALLPDYVAQLLESGNMQQMAYSKYQICRMKQQNPIGQV